MSKKSRRRNKKILGALGALGALALAARGRRNAAIDKGIQSAEDDKGSEMVSKTIMDNMPKKKKSFYNDPITTGGKGVKQGFRTTSANVQKDLVDPPGFFGIKSKKKYSFLPKKKPELKFGQVKDKQGEIKTLTPFDSAGLRLSIGNRKVDKTQAAVNKANKEMAAGMLPPQLREPGRTNITTRQGENRRMLKNIFNFDGIKKSEPSFSGLLNDRDAAAKDGGRITKKGVKRGAAKRGFGRAYTKGRR